MTPNTVRIDITDDQRGIEVAHVAGVKVAQMAGVQVAHVAGVQSRGCTGDCTVCHDKGSIQLKCCVET